MSLHEAHGVDAAAFRAIVAARRPVVLRGLVADWPAVRSGAALAAYLTALDSGAEVDAILLAPEERGRIFYDAAMNGFNFVRRRMRLSTIVEQVQRYAHFEQPPSVAVQSAPLSACAPEFVARNPSPVLPSSIAPRIWVGNAIVTPAHFDESANLACVVGGRRRFTLLPPEQVSNLYVGPLDFAPTGTPLSLVDFRAPDLARFPRFVEAQAAAQVAELEAGDAIFIPPLWWHHVESLERFNVLVNYWWKGPVDTPIEAPSMLDCMLHCMLNLNHSSEEERVAWRALFEHFLFASNAERGDHLPEWRRGLYEHIDPKRAASVRALLAAKLGSQGPA